MYFSFRAFVDDGSEALQLGWLGLRTFLCRFRGLARVEFRRFLCRAGGEEFCSLAFVGCCYVFRRALDIVCELRTC